MVRTQVSEREPVRTKSVKGFTRPEAHNVGGHFKRARATDAQYTDPPLAGRCGDGTDGIV
jgi:hypothetical protein